MKGIRNGKYAVMIALSMTVMVLLAINAGYAYMSSVQSNGNTISSDSHYTDIVDNNGTPISSPLAISDYDYSDFEAGDDHYTIDGYKLVVQYPTGSSQVRVWIVEQNTQLASSSDMWLIIDHIVLNINGNNYSFGVDDVNNRVGTPTQAIPLNNGTYTFTVTFYFHDGIVSDAAAFNTLLGNISGAKLVFASDGTDPLNQ